MNKVISIDQAVEHVKDGMTVMIGGFMGCGSPHKIIDALVKKGVKDLRLVCNDGGFVDYGSGKLIVSGQIKSMIATHIGMNKEVGNKMNAGTLEVELSPQGTFAERIRAGGAGLGGVLTPTGLGTLVEEGKTRVTVDGKDYLLEKPIHADVALLSGYKVDKLGNVFYKGSTRNFNPLMATAADFVIIEADNLVEAGEIEAEMVHTPGLFIDAIVDGGAN